MLVSQALNIAREGIIEAGAPKAMKPHRQPLSPAMRLRRIEYDFAQMILLNEMLDSLTVVPPAQDMPLPEIVVVARNGGAEKDLFRLNAPTDDDFAKELQLIMGYATLRPERLAEITVQTSDLISFFAPIVPIPPARARMLNYLLDLAMNLSTAIVQRIKLGFDAPRPDVLSDQVQPMLPTPLHASYPSGHATQAFAVAMLLTLLTRPAKGKPAEVDPDSQLFRMATRIAVNRTVAGVHFPSDSAAGALLGMTLARWIAVRAGAMPDGCPSMNFKAPLWGDSAPDHSRDFYLARLCDVLSGQDPCLTIGKPVKNPSSTLIEGVWQMASKEWNDRWS